MEITAQMRESEMMRLKQAGTAQGAPSSMAISTRTQLQYSLKQHEEKCAEIREALSILERNPDVERLLTLLGNGALR